MTRDEIMSLSGSELDAAAAEFMGFPFRKPGHGSCCTCQVCGWPYEECECGYSQEIERAFDVEQRIDALKLREPYARALIAVLGLDASLFRSGLECGWLVDMPDIVFALIHAPADARCKAALIAVMDGDK